MTRWDYILRLERKCRKVSVKPRVRGWLNVNCVGLYYSNWILLLVMFLRVPSIDSTCFHIHRVYRGSIFFSLVLILRIRAYLGIKGDHFFSDLGFFLALVLHTNGCTTICITWPILREIIRFSREIECIKFVCNEFVLVLVQIDLIQFENSICIRSIRTKTNTNLLHTNLIHSILHKIGHVMQIVVHQFVCKTSSKKIPKSEVNQSPFIPRYAQIRRINTKEKIIGPL